MGRAERSWPGGEQSMLWAALREFCDKGSAGSAANAEAACGATVSAVGTVAFAGDVCDALQIASPLEWQQVEACTHGCCADAVCMG